MRKKRAHKNYKSERRRRQHKRGGDDDDDDEEVKISVGFSIPLLQL